MILKHDYLRAQVYAEFRIMALIKCICIFNEIKNDNCTFCSLQIPSSTFFE